MVIFMKIFIFLLFTISIYSQVLNENKAESFIRALLNNSEELNNYFDSSELLLSERLGISYSDVKFKQLISIDIDSQIKTQLLNKQLGYDYEIIPLESDFSKLSIKIPQKELKYEYLFCNSKLISKPSYYSRNWPKYSSKYFIFHVSDSSLINEYSINELDLFVEKILEILECSDSEIGKLKTAKIHYFLCKNDDEINKLTGYSARGLYYLANDFIISTFNCHYHEISHLLINYKINSLKLFTQPLLQEGFAVAFGGRGGKEPNVILNMGSFLVKSNFLNYDMLLSKSDFSQYDASLSYPVAGLFTKFLIESIGIEKYLELYIKYTFSSDEIDINQISLNDLQISSEWENYVNQNYSNQPIRTIDINEKEFPLLIKENENTKIYANNNEYLIKVRSYVGLKANEIQNYQSAMFQQIFPNSKYQGEKYILTANENEVSIYNLFTNNLIAKYVKGFSIDNNTVQQEDGYFLFSVSKEIFDEELINLVLIKSGR